MALKITVLLVLVAFVLGNSAQDILYSPLSQYGHTDSNAKANPEKSIPLLPYKQHGHNEKEHLVEYNYSYAVHDDHTKDIKGQEETRHGDVVKGRYEMIDSDGFKRIVEYTADDKNGFQAIVHREPTDIKIPIPEQKPHKEDNHGKYETYHKHTENLDYTHNTPKYNQYKHLEEPFPAQSIQNIKKRHTSIKNGYVAPIWEN